MSTKDDKDTLILLDVETGEKEQITWDTYFSRIGLYSTARTPEYYYKRRRFSLPT